MRRVGCTALGRAPKSYSGGNVDRSGEQRMAFRSIPTRSPHRRYGLAWIGMSALVLAAVTSPHATASPAAQISSHSEQMLERLLAVRDSAASAGPTQRTEVLSRQFLGVPYGANTLVGSAEEPEQLVVELQKVDCFTFADYVEAFKRADNREEFIDALVEVRYKDGIVGFQNRKHFFTDWSVSAPAIATDVTRTLGVNSTQTVKNLNQKDSGAVYLPGIAVASRAISYIPSDRVDNSVLGRLRTGDYVGAYAEDGGLDVTHVGIFVDTPDGPVLRNASSLTADNKVVDSPLRDYVRTVPGIVVLRPIQ